MKIDLKKTIAFLLIAATLLLAFIRENVFLEINAILDGHEFNIAYFYFFNESLTQLSMSQLIGLKWILTASFIMAVAICTLFTIWFWFNSKKYIKILMCFYAALLGLIVVLYFSFWMLNIYNEGYYILRKLIGLAHSPIPLFLSFALFLYMDKIPYEGAENT